MPYLSILKARNFIEGLVASIFIVVTYDVLRKTFKFSRSISLMVGWFITWIMRKLAVNIYDFLSEHHGFTIPSLQLHI
jgi:hypothetical protein